MPRRPVTFGLTVAGATAAANARGRDFEDAVGEFASYLHHAWPGRYLFTKRLNELPEDLSGRLMQFFALSSTELLNVRPSSPRIGDIYRESETSTVMIYTGDGWKADQEGIAPDRVLYSMQTGRSVLIEAKYGDTEGNAHIERAGARATPGFLQSVATVFEKKARYLYIFSGPMVTVRNANTVGNKIGERGERKGQVVQTAEQRRFASARYHRQIEVLFGRGDDPIPWDSLLWIESGMADLISLFESELRPWLDAAP